FKYDPHVLEVLFPSSVIVFMHPPPWKCQRLQQTETAAWALLGLDVVDRTSAPSSRRPDLSAPRSLIRQYDILDDEIGVGAQELLVIQSPGDGVKP
ncbi:hypothetical protein H0H81_003691, partial [Sphagnurus paluster]